MKFYIDAVEGQGKWESGWFAFRVFHYRIDEVFEDYKSGHTYRTKEEALDAGVEYADTNGYDAEVQF